MDRLAIDDVTPVDVEGATRWPLGEALGTTAVAVHRYRLAPGQGLPGGLHAHADQEEAFIVRSGTVTFERYDPTTDPPTAGEVAVAAGEAVRFPPGEFQSGHNDGTVPAELLALGAPRDSEDVRVPLPCPACGHQPLHLDAADGLTLDCPDCDATHVPAPCPDCGSESIEATLDATGVPVAACEDCGARFREPPVRA